MFVKVTSGYLFARLTSAPPASNRILTIQLTRLSTQYTILIYGSNDVVMLAFITPIAAKISETTIAPSQMFPVFLKAFLTKNGARNNIQKLIAKTRLSLQFHPKTRGVCPVINKVEY